MRRLTRRARRWTLGLVVAVLTACGGDDSHTAQSSSSDRPSTSALSEAEVGGASPDSVTSTSQRKFDPGNLPLDAALDPARKGAVFGSDREAVAAFEDAYRAVELNRMQQIWGRMNAQQRFAALEAGKALSDNASMGDYRRMLPAEQLLDAEDYWALQNAAERAARGESLEPAAAPAAAVEPDVVPDSERGTLRGVVVVEGTGEPVEGVELVASPSGLAALQLMMGTGGALAAVTADDGSFEITLVPAGEVSLVGQKLPQYPVITGKATVVAREIVDVRVEVPPARQYRLELPVVLAGVVRDELSGEPVAGVHVSAGRHGGATSDELGRYLIGEADLGDIVLATEHADYHPSESTLAADRRGRIDHDLSIRPITTGSVVGTVVDGVTGKPIANAQVALADRTLTSDESGAFRADDVEAGEFIVTATKKSYRATSDQLLLERRSSVEARLELDPVTEGTVLGVVTDASTQQPVAGARVQIGAQSVETNSQGRFELDDVPAGEANVSAEKAVYDPTLKTIEVVAAESIDVTLALEPITYGTLVVVARDATTGRVLADAEVRLTGGASAHTDAQGRTRFEKVPAGRGSVSAERHAYLAGNFRFELEPATEIEQIVSLEPVTTGVVEGVVVAAGSGRPIPGAEVRIAHRRAIAGADGRFRLEDVGAGDANVTASKAVFETGSRSVRVVAAEAVSLELELEPITYGTITGVVVDAASRKPVAAAAVSAEGASTRTDPQGRFVLERIPAGRLLLSASRPVYETAQESLNLEPAATVERRLTLEPITYGAVSGRVVDAATGAPIPSAEVSLGTRRLTSDGDGRFEAERVDAGRLTVSARKSGYRSGGTSVTLEAAGLADALVELEPIKVGTVEGVVRDARTGEPIAAARVAVGGREVETDAGGRFRLADVDAGSVGASARHTDYADGAVSGRLAGAGNLELDIQLDLRREDVTQLESTLASNGTIDLYGIHFDSGKDQFKPSSLGTLNAVLQVIKRAPGRTFRIAGHTDSDGTDAYNQDLSERRARTVIQWLVDRGIEPERLERVGYGESRAAAPNDTESGKALNRRVELSYAS